MALDDGHDIVEFVGQTGGQVADGRQALLPQARFVALLQVLQGLLDFGDLLLTAVSFGDLLQNMVMAVAQRVPPPAQSPPYGPHCHDRRTDGAQSINGRYWRTGHQGNGVTPFSPKGIASAGGDANTPKEDG